MVFNSLLNIGAEGLAEFILKKLEGFEPARKLIAQTYDGASVMSGHISGVQARIRQVIAAAIYIHCMAHEVCYICTRNVDILEMCRTAILHG